LINRLNIYLGGKEGSGYGLTLGTVSVFCGGGEAEIIY
jgi:hypothetical protein